MPDSDNQKTREQVLGGCQEDERLRSEFLLSKRSSVIKSRAKFQP